MKTREKVFSVMLNPEIVEENDLINSLMKKEELESLVMQAIEYEE